MGEKYEVIHFEQRSNRLRRHPRVTQLVALGLGEQASQGGGQLLGKGDRLALAAHDAIASAIPTLNTCMRGMRQRFSRSALCSRVFTAIVDGSRDRAAS